ncbi:hypothetical protein TWF281_006710 [Arthrobotrys megalospora]
MRISKILATLTTIALAAAPASAAVASPLDKREDGCYKSGLTYSEITWDRNAIANARDEACCALAGDYPGETQRHWCKQFHHWKHINFTARNWFKRKQHLHVEDCISVLTIEMDACARGSWKWNGDAFYFGSDPNVGIC